MTNGHYVLDENHQPREVPLLEWARAMEENRRVDETTLPNGYWISTVFLGIDHNFSDEGPPLLFETMVFPDGPDGEIQERYATWDAAKAGHAEVCLKAAEYPARVIYAPTCKRCGKPRESWQVYCGAACSAQAEAGK